MAKPIVYIGVGVEATTVVPMKGQLVSVAFEAPTRKFSVNLKTTVEPYGPWATKPEEWEKIRANQIEPSEAADAAVEWLVDLKATIIPITCQFEHWWLFDWMLGYTGRCPIGSQPLDLKSFACGVMKKITWRESLLKGMDQLNQLVLPWDLARVKREIVEAHVGRPPDKVEKKPATGKIRNILEYRPHIPPQRPPAVNWDAYRHVQTVQQVIATNTQAAVERRFRYNTNVEGGRLIEMNPFEEVPGTAPLT